jgi:hypothetical protein
MGEKDDLRSLVRQFEDGRGNALDAGAVSHLAVGGGHVQVDAYEDAFSRDVGEVVEGLEGHGGGLPSKSCK